MKRGDLVLLLPGGVAWQEHVGHIYVLSDSTSDGAGEKHWGFDPPVLVYWEGTASEEPFLTALELHWGETRLKKIEPLPAEELEQHEELTAA